MHTYIPIHMFMYIDLYVCMCVVKYATGKVEEDLQRKTKFGVGFDASELFYKPETQWF